MTEPTHSNPIATEHPPRRTTAVCRRLIAPAAIVALCGLGGCEVDDWLYNPSTVGRWQHTPTIVPVLERIDVIESDTGEFVDVTQVTAEDLIPEPRDYVVAPGDVLRVQILDLLPGGSPLRDDYVVDQRGFISLPLIEPVQVANLSASQAQRAVADAIIAADILDQPQVNVQIIGQRQAAFSIYGAIGNAGRYQIPNPDYRLLDALTDAGGVSPVIAKIFVIRQVPLTGDVKRGRPQPEQPRPEGRKPEPGQDGQSLIDLIEGLTQPEQPKPQEQPTPPSPGVVSMSARSNPGGAVRPSLPGIAEPVLVSALQDGSEPMIDLTDDPRTAPADAERLVTAPEPVTPAPEGRWVFLNGEWVKVMRAMPIEGDGGIPEAADPLKSAPPGSAGELVTQRVIEIPVSALLQGVAQYNIIVRPGDRIHVPSPEQGNVYVGGPGIARPGTYQLPFVGRLTLTRLIFAAGGFTEVAIPDRVDITRMIGTDRQATVRLNVKAIFEGTQPDIFIKSDDMLNFGTNFFALPLAVIRGGFRMSYGFGFLLDRNFGNDVFGAPPENNGFNN